MRGTLYTGRVEPSAEASGLYTHALLQVVVVVRNTASWDCILQVAKNMEVIGCQIGNVERMRKNRRAAYIQHTDTIQHVRAAHHSRNLMILQETQKTTCSGRHVFVLKTIYY